MYEVKNNDKTKDLSKVPINSADISICCCKQFQSLRGLARCCNIASLSISQCPLQDISVLQTVQFDGLARFCLHDVKGLPEINLKLQKNLKSVSIVNHLLKRIQLPPNVSSLKIEWSADRSNVDFADFEGFNFTELFVENCCCKSEQLLRNA